VGIEQSGGGHCHRYCIGSHCPGISCNAYYNAVHAPEVETSHLHLQGREGRGSILPDPRSAYTCDEERAQVAVIGMSEYKLFLGDCLEYMRTMPDKSVDAVITDPPYGVGLVYGTYLDTRENWHLFQKLEE
jgi:hypothetical protein